MMYERPARRRGPNTAESGPRRVIPTDAHERDRGAYLRRIRTDATRAAREPVRRRDFLTKLVDRIGDTRLLRLAFDYLASQGGRAPGADGVRYEDLTETDIWAVLASVGTAIRNGAYRHGRDRTRTIPKANGQRCLTLSSIVDRVVARSLLIVIDPYLDEFFLDSSYGFRSGRGVCEAVARAERLAEGGRLVWATADIATAFDNIPTSRLLDIVRVYLPDDRTVGMIRAIVGDRTRGVRQGCPLSPLLLNLFLHHSLDVPWRRCHADTQLLRYADDLLLIGDTVTAVERGFDAVTALCRSIGLPLKLSDRPVRDLRQGEGVEWLGFGFRRGQKSDGVEVTLADRSVERLQRKIQETVLEPGAFYRIRAIILGWVTSLGPCWRYVPAQDVVTRVERATQEVREAVPNAGEVASVFRAAGKRYLPRIRGQDVSLATDG